MQFKILKKDMKRDKVIIATLFLFIVLATALISAAVSLIITLFGSMDSLLEDTNAAHFAQLHVGEINQAEIDDFITEHDDLIKAGQVVNLLNVNGARSLGQKSTNIK